MSALQRPGLLEWELAKLLRDHCLNWKEAGEIVTRLSEQEPDDVNLEAAKISLALEQGQYKEAIAQARHAEVRLGTHVLVSWIQIQAYVNQQRWSDIEAVVAKHSDHEWSNWQKCSLAFFLAIQGRIDEADVSLRELLDLYPDDPDVMLARAVFLWLYQNKESEISLLFQAIERIEAGPLALVAAAKFAVVSGDLDRSCSLLRRVSQMYLDDWSLVAEAALLQGLIACLKGAEDNEFLRALAPLLNNRERAPVSIPLDKTLDGKLIAALQPRLKPEDLSLYRAVIDAIRDQEDLPRLQALPRWQAAVSVDGRGLG